MSGVEGLGRGVLPGAGAPPWAGELAGSLDQLGLQVTSENVLKVAAVLVDRANDLDTASKRHGSDVVVRRCGADPVSRDSASAFTPRLKSLGDQVSLVAAMLRSAAERLADSARAYGHSEAAVEDMLKTRTGVQP
jgi:hypothetical protein